eukprot:12895679-Prorocentrum_lima.AAC.1
MVDISYLVWVILYKVVVKNCLLGQTKEKEMGWNLVVAVFVARWLQGKRLLSLHMWAWMKKQG